MAVEELGESGASIALIPGSSKGLSSFPNQLALADREYRLLAPAARTEVPARIDFEEDAGHLHISLAPDPVHLVGHSYGGLTAIHLAALRPTTVLSLLLVEPAAMSVARGIPEVEHHIEQVGAVFERADEMSVEEFAACFVEALGSAWDGKRELAGQERLRFELLRRQRLPWTANLPLDELRRAAYPKLIVTSGSDPIYEAIADRLSSAIAAERKIVPGSGHRVQDAPAFNDLLRQIATPAR
ncbi:MAG TPA: alpha/beta hydrolase [Gaiellaceae bacterium]|nr:alpha/beta hydrolase [Gaiellaceae bacterium]